MSAPRCTIDTSCLIALDAVDLVPKLSFLFSKVLIPKAVRAELFRRRVTKDRIRSLMQSIAFLELCDEYDQGSVDIVLAERSRSRLVDRGEVEAVVQAATAGAMVIVDDRRGRDLAGNYGLECHGTLWILKRLWELELRTGSSVRQDLVKLLRRKARLPRAEVDAFLNDMGELPLMDTDLS
jgi:predicted nucleic acid-binding protein